MKLFAPKNNWDMKSPESWWPFIGSIQTSSGVAITEKSALSLSAYSCGVRVISETIASLPCHLLERKDERTYAKAVDHPLYSIVHDEPNDEQDSMGFFDSQLALLVGWGDCYAEVERFGGNVVGMWPIHPSRIPLRNIRRNGTKQGETYAGQPGELVFYVNNDDGSETPIPASQMLHIPGVLSQNGITGQGHVALGRNALGISQATEDHAAAFFKNGANPNIAIKSPKIVGKETADRLRQQWQTVFGGVKNHYKTVLLEDGMEPIPFTFSPQVTQLIESRQHNVIEMSRLLRIPPYFLMDLQQAKFNNVESQGQDLVVFSLMPWIVRLEKGMRRQLLTPDEKKKYKFRFNVMGLLRGDQAARAAFYQAGFSMGVFSPNDIREYEDLNPVEGGDQRFVPANNLVPLTAIGEMAQANIDKVKAETDGMKPATTTTADSTDSPATTDAGATDVQATALNGAQITALVQIATMLATDQFPPEATRALLKAAFPSIDESLIDAIVKDLAAFDPPKPEPVPTDPTQPPSAPPATVPEPQPDKTDDAEARKAQFDQFRAEMLVAVEARDEDTIRDVAGRFAYQFETFPKAIAAELRPALDAINETAAALRDDAEQTRKETPRQFEQLKAAIESIEVPKPVEPPPVDTSAAEALAVREAALEQERAALAARLAAERQATHTLLTESIAIRLDDIAAWESKALAKATDDAKGFIEWRKGFYSRLLKEFNAKLEPLKASAALCGVILDIDAAANSYALESINDLKTLDEFAADNWHDRLKEGVDSLRKNLWAGRASALANEMVEQGKLRFKESNNAESN